MKRNPLTLLPDAAGIESLLAYGTLIAGVVAHLIGFLKYDRRFWWWVVLLLILGIIAIRRQSPRRKIGFANEHMQPPSRLWPGLLTAAVILGAAIDIIGHYFEYFPLVYMRADIASTVNSEGLYVPKTDPDIVSGWGNDCSEPQTDAEKAKAAERIKMLADHADNRITIGHADHDGLAIYYKLTYGEQFGFDIAKSHDVAELVIDDVEITVHQFIANDQLESIMGAPEEKRIIIVPIKKLDCKQLPWVFHAAYLLDDAQHFLVTPWQRSSLILKDDFQTRFVVIVDAKDPGFYSYTATLVYHAGLGPKHRMPIIDEPRTCLFFKPSIVPKFQPVGPEPGVAPDKGTSLPSNGSAVPGSQ